MTQTPFTLNRRSAVLALASLPLLGHAQTPALKEPLSIVVGYPPGGASDRAARMLADALGPKLGVTVIVENKPGAGGRVAAQQFKSLPAARNALMLANPAVMSIAPLVFKDVGYDPVQDFQPVSQLTSYDFALAVAPDLPVKDLAGLLAWLRDNPKQANIGVPATGSLPHFFALMVQAQSGVRAEVVGYNGSAPMLSDLLGGQIPAGIDTDDAVIPQHLGGKVRILALSGTQRPGWAPDVPTFQEAGLDLAASGWNTLYAPAAMPAERVALLAEAVEEVMQDAALRQRFTDARITPVGSSRAATQAMLEAFSAQWAPVVKDSGLQL